MFSSSSVFIISFFLAQYCCLALYHDKEKFFPIFIVFVYKQSHSWISVYIFYPS